MRKYFLLLSLFLFVGFEPSSLFAQAGGYSAPQTGSGGSGSGIPYGIGGGTAQAQTVTTTPNITALTTGTFVTWLPVAANTAAAPTLAAGTTAATAITKCGTVALVAGDLLTTVWAVAQYDGTEWVLQNPVQGGCVGGLPTSGGSANTQTLTVSPALTAYNAGQVWNFIPGTNNSGAATMTISGLVSPRNITKCGTTALAMNDLITTAVAVLLDDGTELQLLNPQSVGCGSAVGSGTANTLVKYVTSNTAGNSSITDNASMVATPEPIALGTTPDVTFTHPATNTAGVSKTDVNGNVDATSDANFQAGNYLTGANCAAVGTSASPSVAACTAASAGSVSCAVAQTSCQVTTTAVTANSEIFLSQREDTTTGTRLGVTCNTTPSTVVADQDITAVVAGTSFTFAQTAPAGGVNPNCWSYHIVN